MLSPHIIEPEESSNEAVLESVSEHDAAVLAQLGYKTELRRNFTTFEIFGVAFSIMGLLPGIASSILYAIPAGPVGMVWGWFLAVGLIFIVGLAMAELGSAMPTAGGLYWWTFHFASPATRRPLSFLVGYSNTLGLISGLCGVDYAFSLMLLSIVIIANDGHWEPKDGHVYGVFLACLLCHAALATRFNQIMGKIQTFSVVMNIVTIVATILGLLIGKSRPEHGSLNDRNFIFTSHYNLLRWPSGWTFMLSWLTPIWSIGAFDSCVHMSEEASNATIAVPYGILFSIGTCWILGFIVMIVITASINQDLVSVQNTPFGQPMAQIYYDAVGKKGALVLMSLLLANQFMMGLSNIVPASRQAWAFSRDGALPFSSFIRPISRRFGYIPLRAIWACTFAAAIVGLLTLIAPAASQAVFSLAITGNNVAWGIPILSRVLWGRAKFKPGPFYTGDRFSTPLAWTAVTFLLFGVILAMFPSDPHPSLQTMNYSVVISLSVWLGAVGYYFLHARKWFTGPKTTI